MAPMLSLTQVLDPAHLPMAMPAAGVGGAAVCMVIRAVRRGGRLHTRLTPQVVARICEAVYYGVKGEHSRQWWNRLNALNTWRDLLVLPPDGPAGGFARTLGSADEHPHSHDLLAVNTAFSGRFDPVLIELLQANSGTKEAWEETKGRLADIARNPGTAPLTRLVIARTVALRDEVLGTDLLTDVAFDPDLDNVLRVEAADEVFRWDPARAQLCYEHLANSPELDPDEQLIAAERLGRCDTVRAASALFEKVADRAFPLTYRFDAAERTGRYVEATRRLAYWVLARDTSIDLMDRIPATGRLLELDEPRAEELLQHGAKNKNNPPEARELCRFYLQRAAQARRTEGMSSKGIDKRGT